MGVGMINALSLDFPQKRLPWQYHFQWSDLIYSRQVWRANFEVEGCVWHLVCLVMNWQSMGLGLQILPNVPSPDDFYLSSKGTERQFSLDNTFMHNLRWIIYSYCLEASLLFSRALKAESFIWPRTFVISPEWTQMFPNPQVLLSSF